MECNDVCSGDMSTIYVARHVASKRTARHLTNSDFLAFRIATWIALRGENHGYAKTLSQLNIDRIEAAFRTGLNI